MRRFNHVPNSNTAAQPQSDGSVFRMFLSRGGGGGGAVANFRREYIPHDI